MVNRDQIESFMKNFPSQALILTMEPEDLGLDMLKYMMRGQAETNRFNFMQMVYPGQIAERFMEAWGWLEREGFIAHRPNDINGHGFFVTRAGQRVAQSANFNCVEVGIDVSGRARPYHHELGEAHVRPRGVRHGRLPRL